MAIRFYSVRGQKYGCFSNFSPHSFRAKGLLWETSEHYFQAMKFEGTEFVEKVWATDGPMKAAQMGRDKSLPLRADWEAVKDNVMWEALYHKFSQNPAIKELLLSTGDEDLIEAAPKDYYWGCGADGTGKNMLGKLLVELRYQFRVEAAGV